MTAEYKVHGDVAVITLNNPPVNGMGYATRVGVVQGLDKANADPAVKAVVLTGSGKAFSGGADSAMLFRLPCAVVPSVDSSW